jgi:hypothetical protein
LQGVCQHGYLIEIKEVFMGRPGETPGFSQASCSISLTAGAINNRKNKITNTNQLVTLNFWLKAKMSQL